MDLGHDTQHALMTVVDLVNSRESGSRPDRMADLDDLTAFVERREVSDVGALGESDLAAILSHHVLPDNFDPTAVVGDQPTLIGDSLTVAGDPESGMTVSDGKVTAKVLCGGIPTANATVYVIDSVLTNAMPTS